MGTAVEGAPVACDSTWTNVQGETCQTYAENGWCANLGGGLGDIRRFQDLADFEGRTALVCPECGCKVNQVEPQDKCIGDSCKCPPGMVGVEPFCRPADPEGRTAVEGVACDSTWTNVQGETCQTYAEKRWCANLGGGLGEIQRFQDLADFEGRTALVCPECGCKGETE